MSITDRLQCGIPRDWINDFSQCLFEWQTLVGGILAILAAVIGTLLLHSQIRQSERHETERRGRKFLAARATLPLALSEITGFSRTMIVELISLHNQLTHPSSMAPVFEPPTIPNGLIAALQAFIEATFDTALVDCVCELINEIQVLVARTESLQREEQLLGVTQNIEEYVVQSARLHVIAGSLFPFSRGRESSIPSTVPWSDAYSYLSMQHDLYESDFPGVFAILERRSNAWESIWPRVRRSSQ
ncbi:hypothetical protein [Novosphingobium sp. AAP83]|uniref:hypothetical protein n=1 Tax=Novosphingobium sp. AAP83 TaxID=1523425 RepID=UPI000AAB0412|nr:hypothetical protein [Novosphingobium sp. AAP83]